MPESLAVLLSAVAAATLTVLALGTAPAASAVSTDKSADWGELCRQVRLQPPGL